MGQPGEFDLVLTHMHTKRKRELGKAMLYLRVYLVILSFCFLHTLRTVVFKIRNIMFLFPVPYWVSKKLIYLNKFFRYPIYGGMQDWNYIHGGCFELTLEISDNKWPNAEEVCYTMGDVA